MISWPKVRPFFEGRKSFFVRQQHYRALGDIKPGKKFRSNFCKIRIDLGLKLSLCSWFWLQTVDWSRFELFWVTPNRLSTDYLLTSGLTVHSGDFRKTITSITRPREFRRTLWAEKSFCTSLKTFVPKELLKRLIHPYIMTSYNELLNYFGESRSLSNHKFWRNFMPKHPFWKVHLSGFQ